MNLEAIDGGDDLLIQQADLQITDEVIGEPPPPPSPTVLELDRWSKRRGEKLAKDKELKLGIDEHEAADLHACLFEQIPEFAENPEDKLREQFIGSLLQNHDFETLRGQTVMDIWASEVAMPSIATQWVKLKQEVEKREREAAQGGQPGAGGIPTEALVDIAADKAAQQAQKNVDDAQDAASAFGLEKGQGGSLDMQAVKKLLKRCAKSERLKGIVNLAGRFRRLAAAKQRVKTQHGMDDVIGIKPSDEVHRLIPAEMLLLGDPTMKIDLMRRIAEKQALCREHQGVERVAKGPVMVWVDESGSMNGERIQTAKALALAVAWVARKQKRWCSLVGFSSTGQLNSVALPPGKWDENEIIRWCEHFFNGGTNIPFSYAEELFNQTKAPRGKTDILLITDGETYSDQGVLQKFLVWKKENKAKVISLVLDCDGQTIAPYTDELHKMGSISTAEEGVQAAVSI